MMHTTWTRRDPVSPLSQSGEARRCNNAGYGLVGVLEELSDEQIARNFDANFFGALQVNAAAVISNYAGFSIYGASEVGARRRVGIARRRTKAARHQSYHRAAGTVSHRVQRSNARKTTSQTTTDRAASSFALSKP
jgi:hypothetical protein